MILNKSDWVLKIIIIVVLIMTIIHYNIRDLSNCDKCRFEVEGNKVILSQFMNQYDKDCLSINEPSKEFERVINLLNNVSLVR